MVSGIDDQKGRTSKRSKAYVSNDNDVFIILPDGTRIIVKKDGRVIRPKK